MATWIKKLTAESLARGLVRALLAYSVLVFIAYVAFIVALSSMGIYQGEFSLLFNLAMCLLFYGTLGLHLSPGIAWFGNKRTDRRSNLALSRTLALLGSLSTAFLGSAYFYFDLFKNYWPIIFATGS